MSDKLIAIQLRSIARNIDKIRNDILCDMYKLSRGEEIELGHIIESKMFSEDGIASTVRKHDGFKSTDDLQKELIFISECIDTLLGDNDD